MSETQVGPRRRRWDLEFRQYLLEGVGSRLFERFFRAQLDDLRFRIGMVASALNRDVPFARLHDAEFQVFSQSGEDGIIQHLVARIVVPERTFVELGVNDYRESNTRFLLQKDGWEGLVVDAGTAHLDFIEAPPLLWRHRVYGRSAFLTAENVNQVITEGGFTGDLGLLSIDLDGNDYWILEAVVAVVPRILVVEYNSFFGARHAVTVPYDPTFQAQRAHGSQLYYGASLPALCHLAVDKGYQFVGCNAAGVNAFFVRKDLAEDLPNLTAAEGWVASQHRMPMDPEKRSTPSNLEFERLRMIADLPIHDVIADTTRPIGAVFGLA